MEVHQFNVHKVMPDVNLVINTSRGQGGCPGCVDSETALAPSSCCPQPGQHPGMLTHGWHGDFGEKTRPWLSDISAHHVLLMGNQVVIPEMGSWPRARLQLGCHLIKQHPNLSVLLKVLHGPVSVHPAQNVLGKQRPMAMQPLWHSLWDHRVPTRSPGDEPGRGRAPWQTFCEKQKWEQDL